MIIQPTEEQQKAREVFASGLDLALIAGAGTGKTSTLALVAAATHRRGLYLAFDRTTAENAARRFPRNVESRTAHSLAFRATGRDYRDRLLVSPRIPARQTGRLLGIDRDLDIGPFRINTAHQARLVMGMVRRFCYSNDTEVLARHLEPVSGLAPPAWDFTARTLLRYAVRAWEDICSPDGKLRFEHDHYLKMWALTRPVLPAEFVLLDEAQDTSPVLEEVFLAQDTQRVCTGDPAQRIYAWRSPRDLMPGFTAERLELTRSFRFGSAIAEVASRWLRHADSDMRLTGSGPAASRVGVAAVADAVLCHGSADAIKEVMAFLDGGIPVALTGGGSALRWIAAAAQELKAGHRTSVPELFLFSSWGEVQEYAESHDAAQDLRSLVRLMDAHGPEVIVDAVDRLSSEDTAQVTVSTARMAKGREWDSVRIGPGFGPPPLDVEGRQRPLLPEEARLIYVAVTRARRMLDPWGIAWADDYEKAVAPAADSTVAMCHEEAPVAWDRAYSLALAGRKHSFSAGGYDDSLGDDGPPEDDALLRGDYAAPEEIPIPVTALDRPPPSPGDPAGPGARRYLRGQHPETIQVAETFSMLVSVGSGPAGRLLKPFEVPAPGRDVLLVIHAPRLRLVSRQRLTVHVPASGDSEPVMFELQADAPGSYLVSVTAWIDGSYLGELVVEVTADRNSGQTSDREVITEIAAETDEGAVSLVVRYDPVQNSYRFEFRDADNPGEVVSHLAYSPGPRVEMLVARLDQLAKGRGGYSAAQTRDYLVNAGAGLWKDLVPGPLREQFWERQHRIRQLTILADKDIIPWELLYPLDPGHDAGFLVQQFPVTRAVFGHRAARQLRLEPARFVLPENAPRSARDEVNAIQRLVTGTPPGEPISALTPLLDVIRSGDFGLLHFACHNNYGPGPAHRSCSAAPSSRPCC